MATGLEPLFTNIQGSIKSDFDVLVCSVHWALISSGFKAIGAGEVHLNCVFGKFMKVTVDHIVLK